jgi:hypothetical protein
VNSVCTTEPGLGEPCSTGDAGMQCRDIGTTCATVCVALGLSGDPCTSSRECSVFYTCGANGTCELKPTRDDACDPTSLDCIDDSYCDAATLKCTAPKPDNSPCQSNEECTSNKCDGATSTCTTLPVCI